MYAETIYFKGREKQFFEIGFKKKASKLWWNISISDYYYAFYEVAGYFWHDFAFPNLFVGILKIMHS